MARHSSHILELARRGAEARFRELIDELKMLSTSFPHLRDAIDRDELPVRFLMRQGRDKARAKASGSRRRRRQWSVAARRAAAARMKAFWAERKAAKAK
jgi:hypothetical protein